MCISQALWARNHKVVEVIYEGLVKNGDVPWLLSDVAIHQRDLLVKTR